MTILVWDYKKNIIRIETYSLESLFTKGIDLFGIDSSNNVHELYAGSNAEARYKSGWLGAGGLIPEKAQDRLLICYKGSISFQMYVNEELLVTKSFTSSSVAVDQTKLPIKSLRNNYVEIEISGTGEVYELTIPQESANG